MSESSYKKIADEYLRVYGAQLRGELESIDRLPFASGAVSPGTVPGSVPPGAIPSGYVSPDAVPPGSVPVNAIPPGAVPSVYALPNAVPSGSVPANAGPPGYVPPGPVPSGSIYPVRRSLDHRVRSGIAALKRARNIRYASYAGLAAACLAVALLAPFALRQYTGVSDSPDSSGEQSYVSQPPAPGATPEETSGAAPAEPPAPGAAPAQPPAVTPPESQYEILPLAFDLPHRFTVTSADLDVGKTIYLLGDDKLDDVVVTLERSGDISRYDTLAELAIGGHDAFGSSGNGYNLIAFRDDDSDILYVLTCKHDINTLVLLSESILQTII